ncbi:hypothetical protein V5O48_005155 [Marasmius crinis-equi]|uniref:Uncharacterized protein n=1 Tax=Marasmius crinis-equi TaxID=585013 RepID=A0ABR3FN35_9AGAR
MSYHADANLPRGLGMLYQRSRNANFKKDIEKYLAVQYNAILDLSTTNGSNVYSSDWMGPPPSTVDFLSQIQALGVLVPVIALPDTDGTPNPTPSFSLPSPKGKPVGGIVGGTVGGIIALAVAVTLFFVRRHRKKRSLPPSRQFEQAQTRHVEPFTEFPVVHGESRRERSPLKQNLDSGQMSRSLLPSTALTQNQGQDNPHLLRQMSAALSALNRRLARVEGTNTAGGESEAPPEYPGSVHN